MRLLREHRLVVRFALGSLVAFVAIGLVLSVAVAHQFTERGEEQAAAHAAFVTNSVFRFELSAADLRAPVPVRSRRHAELARFVRTRILEAPGSTLFRVVRLKIWSRNGTVLFADDPRLTGRRFPAEEDLREAFAGQTVGGVTNLSEPENVFERGLGDRLFETYVPLRLDTAGVGPVDAVVELYQDYGGIQRQIDSGFRTLAVTLLVGLAALYVVLLPLAFRASRTLSEQNARLAEQARRLEDLLEQEQATVAQLRELNRLKSDFVAVASHELRTPLTAIIGYAKTLRQPAFAGDENNREEFLEAIERQGDRLFQLVENLLVTSRLEDGALPVSIAPFSPEEAIRGVADGLGSASRRIRVVVPVPLPKMHSDRRFVEQVIRNLLANALKFSLADSECEVGATAASGSLTISVTDHGIGIPADEVSRIFDRFYQVDSSSTRRFGGIGLGLDLVKTLVQALGGTIEVQTEPSRGSTFTVVLPLVHPSSSGEPRNETEVAYSGWWKSTLSSRAST